MNLNILQEKAQVFIADNLKTDLTKLILKGSSFDAVSVQELANQIVAKQKSEHKLQQLNIENIDTFTGDGIDFLKNTTQTFDCIYIDPSRRNDVKGKVFLLKDCLPNVPEHIDFLFSKTNQILLKNSPILDISSAISELKFVKEIHVIAIKNEVKEVLFLLEKNYENSIQVKTINLIGKNAQKFEFDFNEEVASNYAAPLTYLYEPNAAILKSGGFHQIASQLHLFKLHQHSHLYTSENLIDFPGRSFKILEIVNYDKKKIKKLIPEKKANITTRNFPKTVAQIRKETNLTDGGNTYLFFTTDAQNKLICILCSKIDA